MRENVAVLVEHTAELLELSDRTDPAAAPPTDEHPLARLEQELEAPVAVPVDPAVGRLLPPASMDDEEIAVEFRRLTQTSLRESKTAGLRRLRTALEDADAQGWVEVPSADAPAVAAALTDVRLVLADRLGIRTDEDVEHLEALMAVGGDENRHWLAACFALLGWLQESLVGLMLEDARAAADVTRRGGPSGRSSDPAAG